MMRFLIIAMAVLVAGAAQAERRVALVFGLDDYKTIRPLDNAVNDAQAMEETLTSLGFEVFLETNRDLKRMRRALDDFREDAAGADVALVFYAGHGVEISGENRLLPTDTDVGSLDALKASTLPLEEVRDTLAEVGKVGLVLLDACRNDPFGTPATDGRGAVALKPDMAEIVKPGLGRIGRAENMLFAFAAAPGATASDGDGENSPFTTALMKYLTTDGLEIRSVLTLVQQEVYDRSRGGQLPYVESGLPSLFFAATTSDALPERERLLLAMADVTPDIRDEIEGIASANDMPLAPLYGALIGSDAGSLDAADRNSKLKSAAAAFVEVRTTLRTMASSDPQVEKLRGEASEKLSLGAFDAARSKLAEAAAIDSTSRQALKTNFVERTVSEATTYFLSAGAARAELNYPAAMDDLKISIARYAEVGSDLSFNQELVWLKVMQDLGDLQQITGDLPSSAGTYGQMSAVMAKRVSDEPDNVKAQRGRAVVEQYLGDVKFEQGDAAGARAAYELVWETIARLKARGGDSGESADDAYLIQVRLGDVYVKQGDHDLAAKAYALATQEAEFYLSKSPEDQTWKRNLSVARTRTADNLIRLGDVNGALAIVEQDIDAVRQMAAAQPENLNLQDDLAISQDRVGDLRQMQRDLNGALRAYEVGRDIRLKLVTADPGNVRFKDVLVISYSRIGDLRVLGNDLDGAVVAYGEAMKLGTELVALDPSNAEWQRSVMIHHQRLGDVARRRKDFDRAMSSYSSALDIARALAAADATNDEKLRDLGVASSKVGLIAGIQGDLDRAFELYSADLEISLKRAGRSPDNPLVQYDLAIGYEHMGDVLSAQKKRDLALEAYKKREAIVEELAKANPGNAAMQRERIVSQLRLAENNDDAVARLLKALELTRSLKAAGRLSPSDEGLLPQIERYLSQLGAEIPQP